MKNFKSPLTTAAGNSKEVTSGLTNQKLGGVNVGSVVGVVPRTEQHKVFKPGLSLGLSGGSIVSNSVKKPSFAGIENVSSLSSLSIHACDSSNDEASFAINVNVMQGLSKKQQRKRTRTYRANREPWACYVINRFDILETNMPGSSGLEYEHEDKAIHAIMEEQMHLEDTKEDTIRWRNMSVSNFDLYLQKMIKEVEFDLPPNAPSVVRVVPVETSGSRSIASSTDGNVRTTAEILAAKVKEVNRQHDKSAKTSGKRSTDGNDEDLFPSMSVSDESETARCANHALVEAERDCRAHRLALAREVYRLELTDYRSRTKFGDLRYQCVPFQQMHDQTSFAQDLVRSSGSTRRKTRRFLRSLGGTNYAYIAVNFVDGKARQASKTLNHDEYVEFVETHSIIDSGAGANCLTADTHFVREELNPRERFTAFNQTESRAISKGTAIGRALTDVPGKFTPLVLPASFKLSEVQNDLIAVDGLDSMGYKFLLQGAESSCIKCPNGATIPLIKRGRLYWLRQVGESS